ncbi:MAG: nucleotidyltransferase [Candidatus Cloacimonetes bacterium]|nr:nucleotidyltransferase [Candidatus Cloacimonadota bacterium]
MELKKEFETFVSEIRLTQSQKEDLIKGHNTLRSRLLNYEDLRPIMITTFLQGSYRRHTAVRPKGDKRADVDIVVVTKLHEDDYTPEQALELFTPFLDKYYEGKWKIQNRSIGIVLSYVDLDLVITSSPLNAEIDILKSASVSSSLDIVEAFDWKLNESWIDLADRYKISDAQVLKEAALQPEWKTIPLRIPDVSLQYWDDTDPLEQMQWTRDKNLTTSGHFVNVVKAIKWWRLENYSTPTKPKGFPLERLVGECCPDDVLSIAQGIVRTLESIVDQFYVTYLCNTKPSLPDYGVPDHDVFAKITNDDFHQFYEQVKEGAILARKALDCIDYNESCTLWRQLLGRKFPKPPEVTSKGFTPPQKPANPGSGRFA